MLNLWQKKQFWDDVVNPKHLKSRLKTQLCSDFWGVFVQRFAVFFGPAMAGHLLRPLLVLPEGGRTSWDVYWDSYEICNNGITIPLFGISIVDFWIGILLGYQLVNQWRIIGQSIYQLVQDFATIHSITSLMVLMSKWVKLPNYYVGWSFKHVGLIPKTWNDLDWLKMDLNHVETRNSQTLGTRGLPISRSRVIVSLLLGIFRVNTWQYFRAWHLEASLGCQIGIGTWCCDFMTPLEAQLLSLTRPRQCLSSDLVS